MRPDRRRVAAGFLAAAIMLAGCGGGGGAGGRASAGERTGGVSVTDARAPKPATPDVGGVYLDLTSSEGSDDALVGASTGAATRVELHETVVDDGLASMEPVDEVAIPAGATISFKPGGYHLMLIEPSDLAVGDEFALTLDFEGARDVTVTVPVAPVGDASTRGVGDQTSEDQG